VYAADPGAENCTTALQVPLTGNDAPQVVDTKENVLALTALTEGTALVNGTEPTLVTVIVVVAGEFNATVPKLYKPTLADAAAAGVATPSVP
jgi:hypothetical protein